MKANFLKTIMPFAVLMFAVVAAFATQAKEMESSALVDAYIPVGLGQPCENTQIKCETNNTGVICMVEGEQAYGLADSQDETSCRIPLFRP